MKESSDENKPSTSKTWYNDFMNPKLEDGPRDRSHKAVPGQPELKPEEYDDILD